MSKLTDIKLEKIIDNANESVKMDGSVEYPVGECTIKLVGYESEVEYK